MKNKKYFKRKKSITGQATKKMKERDKLIYIILNSGPVISISLSTLNYVLWLFNLPTDQFLCLLNDVLVLYLGYLVSSHKYNKVFQLSKRKISFFMVSSQNKTEQPTTVERKLTMSAAGRCHSWTSELPARCAEDLGSQLS